MLIHSGTTHQHKYDINEIYFKPPEKWILLALSINVTKEITDSGAKETKGKWFQGHSLLSDQHKLPK